MREGDDVSDSDSEVRTVPLWPAAATLGFGVVAAILVFFTLDTGALASFRLAIVGYAIGAVVVPVGMALHRYMRDEAKRSPYFDPRYLYDTLANVGLAVGLVASIWHAFVIATELAR